MTQADIEWWKEKRKAGRARYVFWDGIVRLGTRVGFWISCFSFVIALVCGQVSLTSILMLPVSWAILSVCFGWLIGLALWETYEKNYRNQTGDDHVV
jgi:predicted permease